MEEIVGHRWFSGKDTVGAVLVRVDGRTCAYIGPAMGHDEQSDIMAIRQWGARLPFNVAKAMFPGVDEKTHSDESP